MRPSQRPLRLQQPTAVTAAVGFAAVKGSFFTEPDSAGEHDSREFLEYEAQALLTRLNRLKPFALQMTSVPAAAVSVQAQAAIESVLGDGRRELRQRVGQFLVWLGSPRGQAAAAAEAQRRFTLLRLRFNAVLTQLDLFASALVQRSEHDYGIWLGGLDVAAADALSLPGFYEPPAVICYLDRGAGAAIRRARTRLPGGGENPVAIIRVPRERMIGSGIASSLVHEVGHQAAALLDLVNSLRPELRARQNAAGAEPVAWQMWERWISEIVADFWSCARVGVSATTGLMGVVSLPRAFVFRINMDDPHPFPWIRVQLSCAMGNALFPDPQWQRLASLWESLYPLANLDQQRTDLIAGLRRTMPELISILVGHQVQALAGRTLPDVLSVADRTPAQLRETWRAWRTKPGQSRSCKPVYGFAVIGQARADGAITAREESDLLGELLRVWAVRDAMGRGLGSTRARPATLAVNFG